MIQTGFREQVKRVLLSKGSVEEKAKELRRLSDLRKKEPLEERNGPGADKKTDNWQLQKPI